MVRFVVCRNSRQLTSHGSRIFWGPAASGKREAGSKAGEVKKKKKAHAQTFSFGMHSNAFSIMENRS